MHPLNDLPKPHSVGGGRTGQHQVLRIQSLRLLLLEESQRRSVHWLLHYLQHRDIESQDELIADATVLPPTLPAARQPSSRGAGRFPGSGGFGRRGASFVSPLHPLLCPGLRAVVRRCSQCHTERQLLVTPVHPQPSLPPSPCNTSSGLHAGLIHEATRKKHGYATCLSLCVGCGGCGSDGEVNDMSLAIRHHGCT